MSSTTSSDSLSMEISNTPSHGLFRCCEMAALQNPVVQLSAAATALILGLFATLGMLILFNKAAPQAFLSSLTTKINHVHILTGCASLGAIAALSLFLIGCYGSCHKEVEECSEESSEGSFEDTSEGSASNDNRALSHEEFAVLRMKNSGKIIKEILSTKHMVPFLSFALCFKHYWIAERSEQEVLGFFCHETTIEKFQGSPAEWNERLKVCTDYKEFVYEQFLKALQEQLLNESKNTGTQPLNN